MTARILDGRALAKQLTGELAAEARRVAADLGFAPTLAALLVGDDPASRAYIGSIERICARVGLPFRLVAMPEATTEPEVRAELVALNRQREVAGVIVQMPLPAHLSARDIAQTLVPEKDIDGITPANAGRLALGLPALVPNTPAGGMEILRRHDIPLAGRRAVVVGRSSVVGTPMALLLLRADATVTVCHSRTTDLAVEVRRADIVAVAAGRPRLVTGAMLKPGAVVVDFGINFPADAGGKMVGDVDFASAVEVAGAITPVPGGTGPVTNMMLVRNTLVAARVQAARRPQRVEPD
ncbi:MAG TPA: bifunctional 5,10-methylenetetrahydrofolate dehydrogenase/5,10-methenyltetrahydrofolate cyclohydrolase [Thermomicrobiales bacterium]|nr:bifunctional 5,10-methylenetetrahydrofolate dehydrogenase/5,10-methenyltetrahydrofolate cyclohydrolase [Thermomicrobiales bacterium]